MGSGEGEGGDWCVDEGWGQQTLSRRGLPLAPGALQRSVGLLGRLLGVQPQLSEQRRLTCRRLGEERPRECLSVWSVSHGASHSMAYPMVHPVAHPVAHHLRLDGFARGGGLLLGALERHTERVAHATQLAALQPPLLGETLL